MSTPDQGDRPHLDLDRKPVLLIKLLMIQGSMIPKAHFSC